MSLSINGVNTNHYVSTYEKNAQYKSLGIPDDVISQGQTAIENYAFDNGITLPDFNTQTNNDTLFDVNGQNGQTGEVVLSEAAQNSNSDDKKKLNYNA